MQLQSHFGVFAGSYGKLAEADVTVDDATLMNLLNNLENWFQQLSCAGFAVPAILLVLGGHEVLKQGLLRLLGHDIGESFILEEIDQADDVANKSCPLENNQLLLCLALD